MADEKLKMNEALEIQQYHILKLVEEADILITWYWKDKLYNHITAQSKAAIGNNKKELVRRLDMYTVEDSLASTKKALQLL